MNILIADTETTGLESPIGLVEVAWAFLKYSEEFNEYFIEDGTDQCITVNPEMPITEGASAKHGIRDEDITPDLPTISEVEFPKEPCILVCHNIPFDRPLLEPYLNITNSICTLQLSRRLIHGCDNYQLGTLAAYLGLSRQISHRASGDVVHCAELLIHMLTKFSLTIDQALEFLNKPFVYNYMPWGKHKGLLMSDVPRGYLIWLSKQDLDNDMKSTVKYFLEK